jgi:hypothetical protein
MRSFFLFLKNVLAGALGIFAMMLGALSELCFRQPTVPPPSDRGEFAEIGDATAQVSLAEEATMVKNWAVATLNGQPFTLPAGRLTGWLGSLDRSHAMRIVYADQCDLLIGHIAGTQLFPKLPPVGNAEATRRWIAVPQAALRPRPRATPEPVDYRAVEIAGAIEHVEDAPGAYSLH